MEENERWSANPTSAWSNGLIRMLDAENVSVIGEKGSYIDGCNCYDPDGEQNYRGPHGMSIWRCKNIHLEGYTFINSSNWCHAICKTENITVRNIQVYGGFDGVNIHCCEHVLIEDCVFNIGDDCVAGIDTNDVVVRNCVLNTACMPVRIGGTNILVENCVSDERLAICHFKNVTIACRPGYEDVPMLVAGNFDRMVFENCTIEGYRNPTILVGADDAHRIEVINSTPITVKRVTPEECIEAHPGGIHSGDQGKNLVFV